MDKASKKLWDEYKAACATAHDAHIMWRGAEAAGGAVAAIMARGVLAGSGCREMAEAVWAVARDLRAKYDAAETAAEIIWKAWNDATPAAEIVAAVNA